MRRGLALLALICAAVPGVAVAAGPEPSRAVLSHVVCQRALDPPARAVSVIASMRPVPGTERMAVNFHLLERAPGSHTYERLMGAGLNTWIEKDFGSQPGDLWRVVHPVADLAAPAVYRFVVAFRWSGAGGKVLARTTRISRRCRQPELRPDLVVNSVRVATDPQRPGSNLYYAQIGNTGATGAGPFLVRLSDAGTVRDVSVQHLGAHSEKTVAIAGPACSPSDPPTITVDPSEEVDVSSRSQSMMTVACPGSTASP